VGFYSKAASEDNDEMFLVIENPGVVQECEIEFSRMWNSSQFTNLVISY